MWRSKKKYEPNYIKCRFTYSKLSLTTVWFVQKIIGWQEHEIVQIQFCKKLNIGLPHVQCKIWFLKQNLFTKKKKSEYL